jgi:hypothetical protein
MKIFLRFAIFMLPTFLLCGCGYTTRSLYNSSIKTVAVPMWRNQTFRRQLEFRLTEAIDKNIEATTPYRLASRSTADSVLTGTIVSVQENVLNSNFQTNLPQQTQVSIAVDFTWRDLRTGKILEVRKNFSASASEVPAIGTQLPDAEQIAIERLARRIVDSMQKPW